MIPTVPIVTRKPDSMLQRLNTFLDEHVLPYPVKFLTNRIIILATLALLIPLIFFTSDQAFVNALNSYLNVMSVVVSSTVLLYATIADVRDRSAAKRAEAIAKSYEQVLEDRIQGRETIAKSYEQVLEKRVQADHELIEQILQNSIENILGARLEKIQLADHKQLEELQKVVIASNEALRAELAEKALIASIESIHTELAELATLVQALYTPK
jgi:hypothetical protein